MAEFVNDCPRCGSAKVTFELRGDAVVDVAGLNYKFNVLAQCRACFQCTTFLMSNEVPSSSHSWSHGSLTQQMGSLWSKINIDGYLTIANYTSSAPPEFVPPDIERIYREGSMSLSNGCFNAAGAMFRLSLDMATKALYRSPDPLMDPIAPSVIVFSTG